MSEEELNRAIERIRDNPTFAFQDVQNMSEASITQIVLGILYHYGWDVFNPNEVEPQFNRDIKGRPDIVLKQSMKIKFLIEIKNAREDLNKHKGQIIGYLEDRSEAEMGILTNAVSWVFFKRVSKSDLIEVAEVNIKNILILI